jgi:hypothetical protein
MDCRNYGYGRTRFDLRQAGLKLSPTPKIQTCMGMNYFMPSLQGNDFCETYTWTERYSRGQVHWCRVLPEDPIPPPPPHNHLVPTISNQYPTISNHFQVVRMTGELFHAGEKMCGTMTSGLSSINQLKGHIFSERQVYFFHFFLF